MATRKQTKDKTAVATTTRRRRSPRQERKNEATRFNLLESAAHIIGKHGYAGCTIARVTERASVAHGTFYLHFASQQAMFDEVLPTLGAQMLEEIGQAIRASKDEVDLERKGFKANLDYLVKHPYMYRVLSEAELYAPKAFKQHLDAMTQSYTRSLRRSLTEAHMADYRESELETVATMLIGARTYLLMRYGVDKHTVKGVSKDRLETYLKFISQGISPRT